MSADTVDDLEFAESTAAELAETLARVLDSAGDDAARVVASQRLAEWREFCRPTCQLVDTGTCREGDTCGCPCHDR